MKSQLRFVMHPDDEREFAVQVLSDESVGLIDGPRWRSSTPETYRTLDEITGNYCIIWSIQDRGTLSARHIPTCNDRYCDSESATIQFLRSQNYGPMITEGRIAIGTNNTDEDVAKRIEQRFRKLAKFVKKHYANSVVQWCNPTVPFAPAAPGRSANPSKTDAQVWIGPHALRWLRQDEGRHIKQFKNAVVEARLIKARV